MFDKEKFANIIRKIKDYYESQEEFSKQSDISRTYLSQYMNMKFEKPPTPSVLKKLADASKGVTTYWELMKVCGYTSNEQELAKDVKQLDDFQEFLKRPITEKDAALLKELQLDNIRMASANAIDVDGLSEDEIQEIKDFVEWVRAKNKK